VFVAASKSPPPGSADILVAVAPVAGWTAVVALAMWMRDRRWVQFDGSSVTVRPLCGPLRTFTTSHVTSVRRHRVGNGCRISVRQVGGSRGVSIPGWARVQVLRRLSTVVGIDADRRSAAELEAWRAQGAGPTTPGAAQAMP